MSQLQRALSGLALFLSMVSTGQAASRWDVPITEFVHKIAAVAGPGTATLDVQNLSSLSAEQARTIRRSLETALPTEGIRIRQEHESSVGIRVIFSENSRGWLWIAEVQQGVERRVTMLELPNQRVSETKANTLPLNLSSSLLFSTSDELLDVQPLPSPPGMLAALTTRSVMLYEQQGGRWKKSRDVPIPLSYTLPRDPRGRIIPTVDHPFDLYLPGENCTANADASAAITLNCLASDDPWPLGGQSAFYNSARNYFTGVLVPGVGHTIQPFYSMAMIPRTKYDLWIFAETDGQIVGFDGVNEWHLSGPAHSWGSDITALQTACAGGTQLLATERGATSSDSLQAFEIADREPLPASAPLKFNGSIVALWTTPGADHTTAIVNTAQGGYDVYSVALVCNQ